MNSIFRAIARKIDKASSDDCILVIWFGGLITFLICLAIFGS